MRLYEVFESYYNHYFVLASDINDICPLAPRGFGARYRGFAALLARSNCLNTAELRRLSISNIFDACATNLDHPPASDPC